MRHRLPINPFSNSLENFDIRKIICNFAYPSAVIAQLVEHQLPKLRVAGSSPVYRSNNPKRFKFLSLSLFAIAKKPNPPPSFLNPSLSWRMPLSLAIIASSCVGERRLRLLPCVLASLCVEERRLRLLSCVIASFHCRSSSPLSAAGRGFIHACIGIDEFLHSSFLASPLEVITNLNVRHPHVHPCVLFILVPSA